MLLAPEVNFVQPMKVREFLNTYFAFNRKERMGVIVLASLLILLISIQNMLPYLDKWMNGRRDDTPVIIPVAEGTTMMESHQGVDSFHPERRDDSRGRKMHESFQFDPNTLSLEGWERLGLSEKQAQMIVNYRNKGGRFRKKEDLLRLYCVDTERYMEWRPYIVLREDTPPMKRDQYAFTPGNERTITRMVEINSADTVALISLPGIGNKLANRIIRYRSILGGFYSAEQLKEVYYMDTQCVNNLHESILVDTTLIKKIHINTCPVDSLAKHPYVRWQVAKSIIAYRKQHGPYRKLEELMNTGLFDSKLYSKIAPYLTTQ